MEKKTYVVIRRFGYYINALPNEEHIIIGWIRNNVKEMPARRLDNMQEALASRGFTFNTVSARHLPYIKPFKRKR